jgi:hypothetical protein
MKPAGGISTAKIALQYLVMLNEVSGKWMNKIILGSEQAAVNDPNAIG